MLNEDYREMLRALSEEGVNFLLIGAYAMAAHGYVRATMDMDIWVERSRENSEAIMRALQRFGASLEELSPESFLEEKNVFRIGVPPRSIDIITSLTQLEFEKAYEQAVSIEIEGLSVKVMSLPDLIRSKRATGRKKDAADAEALQDFQNGNNNQSGGMHYN